METETKITIISKRYLCECGKRFYVAVPVTPTWLASGYPQCPDCRHAENVRNR